MQIEEVERVLLYAIVILLSLFFISRIVLNSFTSYLDYVYELEKKDCELCAV